MLDKHNHFDPKDNARIDYMRRDAEQDHGTRGNSESRHEDFGLEGDPPRLKVGRLTVLDAIKEDLKTVTPEEWEANQLPDFEPFEEDEYPVTVTINHDDLSFDDLVADGGGVEWDLGQEVSAALRQKPVDRYEYDPDNLAYSDRMDSVDGFHIIEKPY